MLNEMTLQPLDRYHWQNIRLVASDMDGTLTQKEKFTPDLLMAFNKLAQAGIDVLITTGRSAGWVQAIATYLPVIGAIAENGGVLYWQGNPQPIILSEKDLNSHRQQLARVFALLQAKFPQIQESADNVFRLTDWTFDVANLTPEELEQIDGICQAEGYGFTYSTIQCHLKPQYQDKAYGLQRVFGHYFPDLEPEQIVTVGDSPNDESMFNPQQFPLSVGVANVAKYCDRLIYLPTYITNQFEGAGFCELTELICHF